MQRGQSTVEYAALVGLVAMLLVALASLAGGGIALDLRALVPHPRRHWQRTPDERALLDPRLAALVARALPSLVLERDVHGEDATVPVQADCRAHACATFGQATPTLYVHVLRGRARTVVELWTYYPDSVTDHLPLAPLRGFHHDDWEGLLVSFDPAGRLLGARGSAHVGFNAMHPWWDERRGDWASYAGVAYRASGSHAVGLRPDGIDLAGDGWNGALGTIPPQAFALVAADRYALGARRFDADATAPWLKAAWRDPDAAHTGPVGELPSRLAQAARVWAAGVGAAVQAGACVRAPLRCARSIAEDAVRAVPPAGKVLAPADVHNSDGDCCEA